MSRRTERVASLIRTILAEAIRNRLSDPRIEPLTSITRVEVSADLSLAHVYVSVMAEGARQKLSVEALRHAAGRLRSMVARQVALRQMPQLDFRLDESVQRSFETVQQLDRLMEELGERPDPSAGQETGVPDAADLANGTADREQPAADELPAAEKPSRGRSGGEAREG
ncbi:MAG: 30S ribosome-binding factor RbfA [Phycisphaerae bacterium]